MINNQNTDFLVKSNKYWEHQNGQLLMIYHTHIRVCTCVCLDICINEFKKIDISYSMERMWMNSNQSKADMKFDTMDVD